MSPLEQNILDRFDQAEKRLGQMADEIWSAANMRADDVWTEADAAWLRERVTLAAQQKAQREREGL